MPDLSGGQQRGGGAEAQSQQLKDPQKPREAADDQKKSDQATPPDVFMFLKGKKPQPQKAKPQPQPQPQKSKSQQPEKPKEPVLGAAFKPKMVKGEVQVVRQTMAERIQDAPSGQRPDDIANAAATAGAQQA
jgi:hypothetical protein